MSNTTKNQWHNSACILEWGGASGTTEILVLYIYIHYFSTLFECINESINEQWTAFLTTCWNCWCRKGGKAWILGRKNKNNFCWNRLVLSSVFGLHFESVHFLKFELYLPPLLDFIQIKHLSFYTDRTIYLIHINFYPLREEYIVSHNLFFKSIFFYEWWKFPLVNFCWFVAKCCMFHCNFITLLLPSYTKLHNTRTQIQKFLIEKQIMAIYTI